MDERIYKEKLTLFKESCRVYKKEKQYLETSSAENLAPADLKLRGYIKEDVESVNLLFSLIREKCGATAALMLWMLLVEGKTQADVAYQFGITRRQLQYSVSGTLHRIFEEETDHAD